MQQAEASLTAADLVLDDHTDTAPGVAAALAVLAGVRCSLRRKARRLIGYARRTATLAGDAVVQ